MSWDLLYSLHRSHSCGTSSTHGRHQSFTRDLPPCGESSAWCQMNPLHRANKARAGVIMMHTEQTSTEAQCHHVVSILHGMQRTIRQSTNSHQQTDIGHNRRVALRNTPCGPPDDHRTTCPNLLPRDDGPRYFQISFQKLRSADLSCTRQD